MRVLQEIFAEVVDKNARVADHGKILGPHGNVIKDFAGIGLPAFLEFELPPGSESFILEVNDRQVRQEIPNPKIRPAPSVPIPKISSQRAEPAPGGRRGCLLLVAPLLAAIWRAFGGGD
jgi:hypothetical protein